MFGIGTQELMVILIIVFVLFGGSKLPDLARSLGRSIKEFKKGVGDSDEDKPSRASQSTMVAASSRTCDHCQAALDVAWSHCPQCGTPVGQGPSRPA